MNCLQEVYGCAVCQKSFKFPKHLAKHVEESHSRKDLQNKEVDKSIDNKVDKIYFVGQENFEKHQSICQKTNAKPFFSYDGYWPNGLQKSYASHNIEVPEATKSENLFVSNSPLYPKSPSNLKTL